MSACPIGRFLGRGGIALCTALWASGSLAGPDYTFTVPVEIRDVDARYPYASVGCFLKNAQGGQAGYGESRFDIRPNSRPYAADVTVRVSPSPGVNPSDVAQYNCGLWLCTAMQGDTCHRPGDAQEPNLQVEPGTAFNRQANGPLR